MIKIEVVGNEIFFTTGGGSIGTAWLSDLKTVYDITKWFSEHRGIKLALEKESDRERVVTVMEHVMAIHKVYGGQIVRMEIRLRDIG